MKSGYRAISTWWEPGARLYCSPADTQTTSGTTTIKSSAPTRASFPAVKLSLSESLASEPTECAKAQACHCQSTGLGSDDGDSRTEASTGGVGGNGQVERRRWRTGSGD